MILLLLRKKNFLTNIVDGLVINIDYFASNLFNGYFILTSFKY